MKIRIKNNSYKWLTLAVICVVIYSFTTQKYSYYRYEPDNCIEPPSEVYLRKFVSDSLWIDYAFLNNIFLVSDSFIVKNNKIISVIVEGKKYPFFHKDMNVGDTFIFHERVRFSTYNSYENNKYIFLGIKNNEDEILIYKSEYGETLEVKKNFGIISYSSEFCNQNLKLLTENEAAKHIANSIR